MNICLFLLYNYHLPLVTSYSVYYKVVNFTRTRSIKCLIVTVVVAWCVLYTTYDLPLYHCTLSNVLLQWLGAYCIRRTIYHSTAVQRTVDVAWCVLYTTYDLPLYLCTLSNVLLQWLGA